MVSFKKFAVSVLGLTTALASAERVCRNRKINDPINDKYISNGGNVTALSVYENDDGTYSMTYRFEIKSQYDANELFAIDLTIPDDISLYYRDPETYEETGGPQSQWYDFEYTFDDVPVLQKNGKTCVKKAARIEFASNSCYKTESCAAADERGNDQVTRIYNAAGYCFDVEEVCEGTDSSPSAPGSSAPASLAPVSSAP
ncbi:hypothetical protein NADFUDRAFT_50884, partial [Nadsonia fulvescens var. elongata DSM 6958]